MRDGSKPALNAKVRKIGTVRSVPPKFDKKTAKEKCPDSEILIDEIASPPPIKTQRLHCTKEDYLKKYKLVQKSRCLFMCWLDTEIGTLEMSDESITDGERERLLTLKRVEIEAKRLGFKLPESGILGDCD